jgi:hypothetical protein
MGGGASRQGEGRQQPTSRRTRRRPGRGGKPTDPQTPSLQFSTLTAKEPPQSSQTRLGAATNAPTGCLHALHALGDECHRRIARNTCGVSRWSGDWVVCGWGGVCVGGVLHALAWLKSAAGASPGLGGAGGSVGWGGCGALRDELKTGAWPGTPALLWKDGWDVGGVKLGWGVDGLGLGG